MADTPTQEFATVRLCIAVITPCRYVLQGGAFEAGSWARGGFDAGNGLQASPRVLFQANIELCKSPGGDPKPKVPDSHNAAERRQGPEGGGGRITSVSAITSD